MFTCIRFLIYLFFPLFKTLRHGMKNIRHISHILIKHMKICVVYNYGKLVIIELVESTGLTVLVVRVPSEQFSLTLCRCMLQPRLKWRDSLTMNISRFPRCILSHEILIVLPMPSVSTVLCRMHTATGNYIFCRCLYYKNTSSLLIWAGFKPADRRLSYFIAIAVTFSTVSTTSHRRIMYTQNIRRKPNRWIQQWPNKPP